MRKTFSSVLGFAQRVQWRHYHPDGNRPARKLAITTLSLLNGTVGIVYSQDGQAAGIQYAGLTPGGVGLYRINFTAPASARTQGVDADGRDITANAGTLPVVP